MKKMILLFLAATTASLIFLSCSDQSSTEPKNSAPIINSLTANPETIEVNKTSILTCNATDTNSDALTYSWDKTGGAISGDGHTVTWTAPSTASIYTITVTVSDGKEAVTRNLDITVTEPVPEKYILVSSPNGGENWKKETTQTITWTDNISDDVRIDLYKGGVLNTNISNSVLSLGNYSWDIPTTLQVGSDYKIRITSTSDESVSDYSNSNFTINVADNITVTSPNGSENWQMGTTQTISWTDNISESVKIDLYKGTSLSRTISSSALGTSYSWNIPTTLNSGTDYKIRITSTTNTSLWDESNANFTISGVDIITVSSPNGSESWQMGTTQTISWTDNIAENVKIDLYRGISLSRTISSSALGTSYSWNIPTTLTSGSDYKIRVTSTTNTSLWDESNSNFTISDVDNIKVNSPNGGENWQIGTTQTISWNDNISESVKIELYKGTSYSRTISSSEQGTSYAWNLTTDLLSSADYKIRIISNTNTSLRDDSDANFTISPPPAEMVLIPGGTFQMGDHFNEGSSDGSELPVHSVTLGSFYIAKHEVTQKDWTNFMNPEDWSSYGIGDDYPAYYVTWYAVLKYCNLRSIVEGLTPCYIINSSTDPSDWGNVPSSSNSTWDAAICNWSANGYRLPTEAEWEYAARGGLTGKRFPNGDTISHSSNGDTQANYIADSSLHIYDLSPTTGYHPDYMGKSSPVGSFPANGYGLYDMAGNLLEWCWDWRSDSYYIISPSSNPTGPDSGSVRVTRGGYLDSEAYYCRVSYRSKGLPSSGRYLSGFRLSRTP